MKFFRPITFASLVWEVLGYSEEMWENFDLDIYSDHTIPWAYFTISNKEYGDNCLGANATANTNDFIFAYDQSDLDNCLELYMDFDYDEEDNEDCTYYGECESTYGQLSYFGDDGYYCLVAQSLTDGAYVELTDCEESN